MKAPRRNLLIYINLKFTKQIKKPRKVFHFKGRWFESPSRRSLLISPPLSFASNDACFRLCQKRLRNEGAHSRMWRKTRHTPTGGSRREQQQGRSGDKGVSGEVSTRKRNVEYVKKKEDVSEQQQQQESD